MSLTRLAIRLPSALLARLLLALLLVCNLTLCISGHGTALSPDTPQSTSSPMAMVDDNMADGMGSMAHPDGAVPFSCHQGSGSDGATMGDECQMQSGVNALFFGAIELLVTLAVLLLPLLLASPLARPLLDNWLRDPFLRIRGTHPPSWPRRHLMLSVLRH